jgi:large subunit ribosomal protein L14
MSLLASALSRLRLCAPPMQARWKGGPGGVQRQTRLTVIDNSGAKKLKVIDYFGRRPATLGSAVRASVKEAKPDGRVSRKEIVAAVVVRQKAVHTRRDGTTVRFHENAAVLMKRDLSGPVGTRVTGPVARELRQGKFMKVALMAPRVI